MTQDLAFAVILIGGIIPAFIVSLMVGRSLIEDIKCRDVSMIYFDAFMLVYSLMSLILFIALLAHKFLFHEGSY